MPICPKCKSTNLRRSRTKGWKEKSFKKLGWRAFRCREKDCGWRGLLKTESLLEPVVDFIKLHKAQLIALLVGIVLLSSGTGLFIYYMSY